MRSSELLTFHNVSSGWVLVLSNIWSVSTLNQFSMLTICHIYWLFHLDCDKYSILFSCRIGTVSQSTKLVLKVCFRIFLGTKLLWVSWWIDKKRRPDSRIWEKNRNSSHDLLHSSGKLLIIGYVCYFLGKIISFLKLEKQ